MNRQKIFELIEKERAYQDSKFGKHFDSQNSAAHWILYIEEYLIQAKKKLFGLRIPGGAQIEYPELDGVEDATFCHSVHTKEVVEKLKKVATLAVAAIEYLEEEK